MLILNAMAYILLSYNQENIKQEEVKMAFIDYYKILGVKKDIPQKMSVQPIASAQSNSTPTFTPTMQRQKQSFRHCLRLTK